MYILHTIEYRKNSKIHNYCTQYATACTNPPLHGGDDDIRLPWFPFILQICVHFSNSERGQTRERQKYVTDSGQNFTIVFVTLGSSDTRYLTILPRLISVSRCQVLQEILLVFVR